jgi:hypothetical protein
MHARTHTRTQTQTQTHTRSHARTLACVGVSVCRCVGVSVCRCVGVSVCRCVGASPAKLIQVMTKHWISQLGDPTLENENHKCKGGVRINDENCG